MEDEIWQRKKLLRRCMKQKRQALSQKKRIEKSLGAAYLATSLAELQTVSCVALYGALLTEIDPAPLAWALLQQNVSLCYPKVETKGELRFIVATPQMLTKSKKGIPEPFTTGKNVPIYSIDAFLVPGLAFDTNGGRLGFGGGYYDRALLNARQDTFCFGYAFDFQIVSEVPRTSHDVLLDAIVTDSRVIRVTKRPFS